jgi:prepilin-type N-terminal cleavage/methylation domain-containing protein
MANTRSARSEQGYTLIEMMMTVLLLGIVSSMAVFQIAAVRPGMNADGAMRMVMGQLNYAREMAISQRRKVEVKIDTATNLLQVIRQDLPNGTTVLSQVTLEGGATFALLGGVTAPETGFGYTSAADFGGKQAVFFTTDGSLIDSTGAPANAALYILIPEQGATQRSVTVLGTLGRVRGYRWNGSKWARV